ncbi:aspartate aminotransferase family protein [Megamonas funiformis]|jgi:acetylornithine/N-succinyldiaminopimelate aminotransferase|uniref:aspartate aminotransferase family protein n=1 Tax=Megamonas funiformis TaxID=437897 RepID=UPI000E3F17EA|nr:aspartate aminotransferase family protein [Megamonas funiformis]RGJ99399.1 aspartate aminotransferase family protein [Megamonas funiformis]
MLTNEEIFAKDKSDYLPVFARYNIVLDHGDGPYVYDTKGKKYIDFLAGIAVNVVGHNYKPLVDAVSQQASKMIHCSNLYYTEVQVEAAEKLKKLSGMDKVFFGNSGAEANEGAIKLARKYATNIDPEKIQIISALHSFHGRTLATLTATGQDHYHHGFGPLPAGFDYVPYNDIQALEAKMSDKTCAVMLEAIQGEGGVHVPDPDYLPKVRALCDKYNAVLIFDEVQCGMGRTGTFFGCQQFGVKPDIVTLAKGLAGGVPIGAFMATDKVASAFHAGDHGSTFGGNPLACAATCVVLDALIDGNLMENAKEIGAYLQSKFEEYKAKYPNLIKEVRGRGLILGMELTRPGREIANECLDYGAIINCTAGNVLRFVPPLNITKAHVDELISVLDKVLPKYA